jgi:hypothetical protein
MSGETQPIDVTGHTGASLAALLRKQSHWTLSMQAKLQGGSLYIRSCVELPALSISDVRQVVKGQSTFSRTFAVAGVEGTFDTLEAACDALVAARERAP